ncbi:heme peroxidase family protein [Poseidonocella sp. HB161398]|uniref:peroxidase family protein n=1 Tax=Poseidonocella sp. HB161398 TaxID=2320855 RepID=UPI0011084CA0|nr:heme peroxidase family protein [Poseidonocella sp. HB161398]
MIFIGKHGRMAVPRDGVRRYEGATIPIAQACGYCNGEDESKMAFGPFGYLFPDAPIAAHGPGTTARLDALAEAMVAQPALDEGHSQIPSVFTFLGQFIDHDVTANTDREAGMSVIDADEVEPLPRRTVAAHLGNLRAGALNLDSVYGGGPNMGPFAQKMQKALRFPADCAKLWIGTTAISPVGRVPIPADPAADLLRLARAISDPDPAFTEEELRCLPPELRDMFVDREDGSLRLHTAIIGDPRNDENLVVAQLHLGFLRFHNKVVDEAPRHLADVSDRSKVFTWARKMVRLHYQWIVLHDYLPAICDPGVLAGVVQSRAALYRAFCERVGTPGPGLLPVPLEFSVAAFRFGHSMVRASYDWNRYYGRPVPGVVPLAKRAGLPLLFANTGNAAEPMPLPGGGSAPRLPSHMAVEWERLVGPVTADAPDRSARRIDTMIEPPLADLANEETDTHVPGVMRHLARRNLRRGLRLNLPSGQACLAAVNATGGPQLPALDRAALVSGPAGAALEAGGFAGDTPLWVYILKEAECLGSGGRLGPLGSRLVAETLVGLLAADPGSVLNQPGTGPGGRWRPADGVAPGGIPVDSIAGLLRAAALL